MKNAKYMYFVTEKIPFFNYFIGPTSGREALTRQVLGSNAAVDLTVKSFRSFVRTLRKYALGSLRKTPVKGTPPLGPISLE